MILYSYLLMTKADVKFKVTGAPRLRLPPSETHRHNRGINCRISCSILRDFMILTSFYFRVSLMSRIIYVVRWNGVFSKYQNLLTSDKFTTCMDVVGCNVPNSLTSLENWPLANLISFISLLTCKHMCRLQDSCKRSNHVQGVPRGLSGSIELVKGRVSLVVGS